MMAATVALLTLADAVVPGGRQALLDDLAPLVGAKKFFTTEDVAERYAVSLPTVKFWRQRGVLVPGLKIPGGTVRYTLAELLEFEKKTGRKEAERQQK